jgi:ABC-type phosphate transport system permease subunit
MAVIADQHQVDLREPKGWRRTNNRVATILMVASFVVVLIPLGFVLFTVIAKGASVISWQFLTGGPIPPNVLPADVGGMGPAVLGTIEITAVATRSASWARSTSTSTAARTRWRRSSGSCPT